MQARLTLGPASRPSELNLWLTDAPDRIITCSGAFLQKNGTTDPFGLECREAYRAPCPAADPAKPESATCVGDLATSFKVQFSPRRGTGAVAVTPVSGDRQVFTVWINPLQPKG